MQTFSRFPANTLIKGANICWRPTDDASFTFIGGQWGGGGQIYDFNWIKRQIDIAKSLNMNTVRILGDVELQLSGALNSSLFLQRMCDVIAYAQTLGIYCIVEGAQVYQCAGVANSGTVTEAALVLFENLLTTVQALPNVIAFDPIGESMAWVLGVEGLSNGYLHQPRITFAQLLQIQADIYDRLKPQSQVPLTFSGMQASFTDASAFSAWQPLLNALPYLDYLDFHIYYPIAAADPVQVFGYAGGRAVIIGEFGTPVQSNPSLGMACPYDRMFPIVRIPGIAGALCWTLADQTNTANDQWGVADNNGNFRPSAAMIAAFPEDNLNQLTIVVTNGGTIDFNKSYDLGAAPLPPSQPVSIQSVSITPTSVPSGTDLAIAITVINPTANAIDTQGPNPGQHYIEGQSCYSLGFPDISGKYRVAIGLGDPAVHNAPYRWGLGASLLPGETRTINGTIRLNNIGTQQYSGGLVQESVAWIQIGVGQVSVTVN